MTRFAKIALGVVLGGAIIYWFGLRSDSAGFRAARVATAKAADAASAMQPTDEASNGLPTTSAAGSVAEAKEADDALARIPPGQFRKDLEKLSLASRRRALNRLAKLSPPKEDYGSLHASPDGALYYVCVMPLPPQGPSAASKTRTDSSTPTVQAASSGGVPIATPPVRHSRPGSANVLYLDFNGYTIAGTRWNSTFGPNVYVAKPYDTDGDSTTFSTDEQAAIVQIWERVAEDYSPFDIDVTTEEPATFTSTTGRALITAATDANGVTLPNAEAAGGVAFVDVFGHYDYATSSSPALIYYTSFGSNTSALAEAVAHELGHNLGLSHQGQTNGNEYYLGHGTGDTSWGPIMGAPYGRNVTQWARGDYYLANNKEDAVAIIAAHAAFRPASAGSTLTTAAAAPTSGANLSVAGVLINSSDVDVYSFNTTASTISLTATTYHAASGTNGGDADVKLELLDAKGTVVASADPTTSTNASLSYRAKAGTYYARLTPAATGNPLSSKPSGYTTYGSIGQYTLTGTIGAAAPAITSATSANVGGGQWFSYQIVATGSPTSYSATALPSGLSIDPATGIISGRPLSTGVFNIGLGATNSLGTGTATLVLTVTSATPAIVTQTTGLQTVAPGDSLTLSVTAISTSNAITYSWTRNGHAIPGATNSLLVLTSASRTDSGFYQALVTNSAGTAAGALVFVRVAPVATQTVAWGDSSAGLTSIPSDLGNAVGMAVGYSHVLAVTRDGGVRGWGSNSVGETAIPAGLTNAVAVAAGYYDSLALKADGTLVAWGYNANGQRVIPAGLANVVAIAGGYAHFLALKLDGTVVAWGDNTYGQTNVPAGLSGVVAIGAGRYHSLAVKADGTVVAWGSGSSGQTTVPAGLTNVVAVAGGAEHSVALKSDGTVVSWGYSPFGSITTGNGSVTSIAAGLYHSLGLLANGTVAAWGYNNSGETIVPAGLDKVFVIAGGNYCSFALRDAAVSAPAVAPAFTLQPLAQTVNTGDAASFAVSASGSPAPTLQWQASSDGGTTWSDLADNATYAGTTTAQLTVTNTTVAMSGEQLRCVASNAAGDVVSGSVTLTVLPLNTAPTISAIADQTILSDGDTGALPFTINDAETPAAALLVSAASSNAGLVPMANIGFGGSGANRTVTVTPAPGGTGSATITVTVSDGALAASSTFVVTVNPANTPPTISGIANQTANEDTATAALAFTVGDAQTAATDLVVSASSSNEALVPAGNIGLGGAGAARTVTLTPAPNANGVTTITLTVSDGVLSASSTFTLSVTPVNDAPTITGIPEQSVATNGNTGPLAFTIGDVETPATSLTLSRASSNTTLVPTANIVLGGSGASRTVTVTPAASRTGAATITITVSDGALTAATTFVVTVSTPNTAPTITNIASQSVNQDTATAAISFTVGDAQTAAGNLIVSASSSNETLVPEANIALGGTGSRRTIKVTPAARASGTAVITVTVSDGELSAIAAFVLTVKAANQPPTITSVANQTIVVNGSTAPLAFVIDDSETAATDLTLSASSSNTTLVPTANIVFGGSDANRTVVVTAAASRTGTATITLKVSDGTLSASTSFAVKIVSSNNNFADANTLTGAGAQATGSNAGATKESREPNHAGDTGGHSVWWEWTAPASGTVALSTDGSTFGTLLAVYTGSSLRQLSAVASSADSGAALTNEVTFNATAGTSYKIAVDGYQGATGSIVLTLAQDATAQGTIAVTSGVVVTQFNSITIGIVVDIADGGSALSAQLLLPARWSYVAGMAGTADVQPQAGDGELLEWKWSRVSAKSVQFTYTLARPAGVAVPTDLTGLIVVSSRSGTRTAALDIPLQP